MQSTARLELEIDLLEKRRQALQSDLAHKRRQHDKSMPCDDGMSDPDVALLTMSGLARDRDRLDSEIAEKELELYDLQGPPINDKDLPAAPQVLPRKAEGRRITGSGSTNAGRILLAVADLAGTDGQKTFSRRAVRDCLGLSNRAWQSGYTAIFQGMRDDHPGDAPSVGALYSGVFHRVGPGTYVLSAKGRHVVEGNVNVG